MEEGREGGKEREGGREGKLPVWDSLLFVEGTDPLELWNAPEGLNSYSRGFLPWSTSQVVQLALCNHEAHPSPHRTHDPLTQERFSVFSPFGHVKVTEEPKL